MCYLKKLVLMFVFGFFAFCLEVESQELLYIKIQKQDWLTLKNLLIQQTINLQKLNNQTVTLQSNLKMQMSLIDSLKLQLNQVVLFSQDLTIQLNNLKASMSKQSILLKNTIVSNEILKKTLGILLPIAIVISLVIGAILGSVIEYECFKFGIIKI
jgi:hypothetical protein